ncbi:TPA: hypothetical protein ACTUT5_003839 [Legionella anisa]|uniref:hypothetical protein n=1 Tax=Legionella anisa TaxID=28082 RepID=UPI00197DE023|nr:hypothetical protein [Legionella anisa]MBN5937553.1 hypothetical protein [Legionella anisa]
MPKDLFSLEQTRDYAEKAKTYARGKISGGSTHLENNTLPPAEFERLNNFMEEVRHHKDQGVKKRLASSTLEDKHWVRFETTVEVSSESHFGSCHELAFQALDYILKANSEINAEIFSIQRAASDIDSGDHEFLVLNRKQPSDPKRPETWGDDAVICDPWANKVYAAKEYRSQLEAYKYDEPNKKNRTVRFNSEQHIIDVEFYFTSNYLPRVNTVESLKSNFSSQAQSVISMLESVRFRLEAEKERLKGKPKKADIISGKIQQITQKIGELNQRISDSMEKKYLGASPKANYDAAKSELTRSLHAIREIAQNVKQFSPEEQAILFKPSNPFGSTTDTQKNLKEIDEEATLRLSPELR